MTRKISKIVIHHSVSPRDQTLAKSIASFDENHKRLHKTKNSLNYYIAYHFVVAGDWSFLQTRPISEVGFHGSDAAINKESIGICLTWNFDIETPTEEQYATLRMIIKNFPDAKLHTHNEFAKKSCPWKNFNLSLIEKSIMLFYEKLRTDNYKKTKEEKRIFKDPKVFIERMKNLNNDERLSESTFLLAILVEKLGKTNV